MKKILCIFTIFSLALALTACGGGQQYTTNTASGQQAQDERSAEPSNASQEAANSAPIGTKHAEITVEGYGTIKVELDGDTAPVTVGNFVKLAQAGVYDGSTFHRIMQGFMIQGGMESSTYHGEPIENIKGEFAANGVENNISHVKGVISMARATPYDSASSQFFIVESDSVFLDGQYAGFGHVTEGIEIVEQIAADARPVDNNGTILPDEQPVITSIVITD